MTVHERVAGARETLSAAGIGDREAALSARILAQHVLGWDTTRYFTSGHEPEPSGFDERYSQAVARRAAREPAAYIMGLREFWGLPLEVSPAVLIPRPETELIVEAALDVFGATRHRALAIADACTGSGNLAIALAHELERSSIVATDISADALQIARRNAQRHRVAARVRFVRTNILDGVAGPFDLVVANPPYVARTDRQALQPEVRDHEPGVALFGGVSGTEIVATVLEQGAARLRPGGYLMMEFGFGQEIDVAALVTAVPQLTLIDFRRDLQGLARIAIARRTDP